MNHYVARDHQRLSKHVANLTKKWMVSYDEQEFILNLYADRRKVRHSLSRGASNRPGTEIIIFSDLIHFDKSTPFLRLATTL